MRERDLRFASDFFMIVYTRYQLAGDPKNTNPEKDMLSSRCSLRTY